MSYDLLAWNAWARNATTDEIAEKLTQQQAEVARLRSVCRECINTMTRCQERECRCNSIANPCPRCRFRQTIEYAEEQMSKSEAGKEATDGQ